MRQQPSVAAARPGICPRCGTGCGTAGSLRIVGHGVRVRYIIDICLREVRFELRRYRCRVCRAVLTVGPSDLLPYRHYTIGAIALALVLWSLLKMPARKVRTLVSPARTIGDGSLGGWPVLRRWAKKAKELFELKELSGTQHRSVAASACRVLSARAPPSVAGEHISERAVCGAVRDRIDADDALFIRACVSV